MGRKSSSKGNNQTPAAPSQSVKRPPVMGIAAVVVAVIAVAGVVYWQSGRANPSTAAAAQPIPEAAAGQAGRNPLAGMPRGALALLPPGAICSCQLR